MPTEAFLARYQARNACRNFFYQRSEENEDADAGNI